MPLVDRRRSTRSRRLGDVAAEWASSRWIDVDGINARYRVAGSGPPVVLVHGLGVSADYWVRNADHLAAAGFRVLAPDLPGFGRTAGPSGGLDVPGQAAALRAWVREMRLGPAFFLGHSLSCQTLIQLAADYPEEVDGLILAAPTGDGPRVRRLLRQAVSLVRAIPRESLKLSLIVATAYLRAGPGKVVQTWLKGARHDPLPLLSKVTAPCIVIVGENDPVVSPEFASKLADGLGAGEVVLIPDASHGVIFDSTGAFNLTVINFIESVRSGEYDRAWEDRPTGNG